MSNPARKVDMVRFTGKAENFSKVDVLCGSDSDRFTMRSNENRSLLDVEGDDEAFPIKFQLVRLGAYETSAIPGNLNSWLLTGDEPVHRLWNERSFCIEAHNDIANDDIGGVLASTVPERDSTIAV